MSNKNLNQARINKKDEFYTQYKDIEKEISIYIEYNQELFKDKTILCPCDSLESNFTKYFIDNFTKFGLKKLICTSYVLSGQNSNKSKQLNIFEEIDTTFSKGQIFTLTKEDIEKGKYSKGFKNKDLKGDGDFRSAEVTRLRDEADIIITNPPFSLFRKFVSWIFEANKKFLIIGHQNAITYKEFFPLIKNNKAWLGNGFKGGATHFISQYKDTATASDHKEGMIRVSGVVWFTNIEHGRRHQPLELMTMADNIKHSKHKEIKGQEYKHYDNYDAIEVPYTDAIPSDYAGIMGVPISFFPKYCSEQFEIIGISKTPLGNNLRTKIYEKQIQHGKNGKTQIVTKLNDQAAIEIPAPLTDDTYYEVNGKYYIAIYPRILIKHKYIDKQQ